MKKHFLIFVLCASLGLLGACKDKRANSPDYHLKITTSEGKTLDYDVELAITQEEMTRGLMGRKELKPGTGMLFIFGNDGERAFWMKDTLIPLDMLFIKSDGSIHRIHPNAQPGDLTQVFSRGPIRAVLEINGGEAEKQGIRPGDTVHHVAFGNAITVK